ncbi:MAG: hemoglobin [Planctomycetota bacterium]|jgi:hemoglobin
MGTLYERLGGKDAVSATVDLFYSKVMADDRIKHFFDDVDMQQQVGKQRAFLTMAFGGPTNYSGEDMATGHAHLVERGLIDSHSDAVMEHLGGILVDLGVAGELIVEAAAVAESVRDDVLGRDTSSQSKAA